MIWMQDGYSEADRRGIGTVYRRYGGLILKVAGTYLSKEDAEDALHDVIEKLARKYRGNISFLCDSSRSFFVIVTKNHCIDVLRKRNKVGTILDVSELEDERFFVETEHTPQHLLERKTDREVLAELILELRPSYREILEYRYILEYTNIEIAQLLGVTPSVVSTRLKRARGKLRELIEERGDLLAVSR